MESAYNFVSEPFCKRYEYVCIGWKNPHSTPSLLAQHSKYAGHKPIHGVEIQFLILPKHLRHPLSAFTYYTVVYSREVLQRIPATLVFIEYFMLVCPRPG
jgi:hypothetical protein